MKLLLFDLDGTLLRKDKTVSPRTRKALELCRKRGILIGIATSRSEMNCIPFLPVIRPDVFISSSGTLVKYRGQTVHSLEFSPEETRSFIHTARSLCGEACRITADTRTGYFGNFAIEPGSFEATMGDMGLTDFLDFPEPTLKICVDIPHPETAARLSAAVPNYCCFRFSGSDWYQFTKNGATKEQGARALSQAAGIPLEEIAAFGDDLTDMGMLRACGTGVAMGNAAEAVKAAADVIIGTNEEDGIAIWLENYLNVEVRNIYGENRFPKHTKIREACRGILLDFDKILLTYEVNTDQWFTPGGGLEGKESITQCCARELAEETGLLVEPFNHYLTINEYYDDWLFISHYFLCRIIGKTQRLLTERELEEGLEPRWIPFAEALSIFSKHQDYADNEMKRGAYLREYEALCALTGTNTDQ